MRVVVSFTTIPSRISSVKPMLESILAQTRKPDRTVLWLPAICRKENIGYDIPSDFKQWMMVNDIEIGDCGCDWGSATKLIPTLLSEEDGDTALITVDDDVAYEPHIVEELITASEKWPDDSLGFMGGVAGPIFIHAEQLMVKGVERTGVDVLGGYRGILYRRRMFDGSVVDELNELLDEGPFVVDDQLFGWNLCRRKIGRFVIRTNYLGPNNGLNFRFLHLKNGIYDGEHSKLADECIVRLEALYKKKGWVLT